MPPSTLSEYRNESAYLVAALMKGSRLTGAAGVPMTVIMLTPGTASSGRLDLYRPFPTLVAAPSCSKPGPLPLVAGPDRSILRPAASVPLEPSLQPSPEQDAIIA